MARPSASKPVRKYGKREERKYSNANTSPPSKFLINANLSTFQSRMRQVRRKPQATDTLSRA